MMNNQKVFIAMYRFDFDNDDAWKIIGGTYDPKKEMSIVYFTFRKEAFMAAWEQVKNYDKDVEIRVMGLVLEDENNE